MTNQKMPTVWQGQDVPAPTPELSKSMQPRELEDHRRAIFSSPDRILKLDGIVLVGLTRGEVAITDLVDFDIVSGGKWYCFNRGRNKYATRMVMRVSILMHRRIICPGSNLHVDHINGNGLDNRRENLRIVTPQQNSANQKAVIGSITGERGVYKNKGGKSYFVCLMKDGKKNRIGSFTTKSEALKARDELGKMLYGEYFGGCENG